MKITLLRTFQLLAIFTFILTGTPAQSNAAPVSIRYAKGFMVEYVQNAVLVTVTNPWPGAKASFKYLLKQRGHRTPAGFEKYQVIEVPIKQPIVLSTTFLAFFEQLHLLDTLIGFSDLSRVHSPVVLKTADKNGIVEVGSGANLQVETVIDLNPDIIFTFATGSFRDVHPKLQEAGLKVGLVGEYMESHPLGRSEWIKFIGLFYNKGEEAEKIFNNLEQRYLMLATKTANLQQKPTVIGGVPFSGSWYVAGGNSYIGRILRDAGADYVWKETTFTGARPMDIELVYERGIDADFWLNTGIWTNLSQARETDPRFLKFKSLQAGKLFNSNKRVNSNGGNDYWESGIMAPDVILADLIHILHPQLLPEHQLVYYTHLK